MEEQLMNIIRTVREKQVVLDSDLAKLYGVDTKRLNEQVKRNMERFPDDFMFQLTKEEVEIENLKSQFATSSWGGSRKLPYAFTEHGIAMLSGVLRSPIAIEVNIRIMRMFIEMRHVVANNANIFNRIDTLEQRQLATEMILSQILLPVP